MAESALTVDFLAAPREFDPFPSNRFALKSPAK